MAEKKTKIRFLTTRIVEDGFEGTRDETRFEKGKTYSLPERSAQRWLGRGLAELASKPSATSSDEPGGKSDNSNIEAMGAKVATAVKDKAALQKQIQTLQDDYDELEEGTMAAEADLKAQLKAANEALATVTSEKEDERAFAESLLDLLNAAKEVWDELPDLLHQLLKDHGRSDQLDLSPRDMAKNLAPNPPQDKK